MVVQLFVCPAMLFVLAELRCKVRCQGGVVILLTGHPSGYVRPAGTTEIVERILAQEDDPDPQHDGYQRRLVMVQAGSPAAAERVCRELAGMVREAWRLQGRLGEELSVARCERPPGRKRYEFGRAHGEMILESCRSACYWPPANTGTLDWIYSAEAWHRAKLLFVGNADAMAQAGRNVAEHRFRAGEWVRRLSDLTRVRQVLFGSGPMVEMLLDNGHLQGRTDAYRIVVTAEDRRRRLKLVEGGAGCKQ